MDDDIYTFFLKKGIIPKTKGEGVNPGNFLVPCPFCMDKQDDPHLSIHESNGLWMCWRCKKKGRSYDWLKTKFTYTAKPVKEQKIIKPISRVSAIDAKYCKDPLFINYIKSRGMEVDDFDYLPYTIFVSKKDPSFGGRVIYYTYKDNEIFHIYGRDYTGSSSLKHKSKICDFVPLYRFWDLSNKKIIIFESCFDAIKFESIVRRQSIKDISCSAFFTSTVNNNQVQQLFSLAEKSCVYFIPDNDKNLFIKMNSIASFCKKGIYENILSILNIPSEYKDIGDMPRDYTYKYVETVLNCI